MKTIIPTKKFQVWVFINKPRLQGLEDFSGVDNATIAQWVSTTSEQKALHRHGPAKRGCK
jgi:hypothetical protein